MRSFALGPARRAGADFASGSRGHTHNGARFHALGMASSPLRYRALRIRWDQPDSLQPNGGTLVAFTPSIRRRVVVRLRCDTSLNCARNASASAIALPLSAHPAAPRSPKSKGHEAATKIVVANELVEEGVQAFTLGRRRQPDAQHALGDVDDQSIVRHQFAHPPIKRAALHTRSK